MLVNLATVNGTWLEGPAEGARFAAEIVMVPDVAISLLGIVVSSWVGVCDWGA